MPNGQDRYVALPDGRYVHIPGDTTPEQLSALREKLRGQTAPKEGWFKSNVARPFNESASGGMGGSLSEVGTSIKSIWDRLRSVGPITAVDEFAENMMESQKEAVGKRAMNDPNRYIAAIPLVGPTMAQAQEEGGVKGFSRDVGMLAGGALGSKVNELPGAALEKAGQAAESVKGGVRSATMEALNVPERAVKAARDAHTDKMAEVQLKNLEKQNDAMLTYQRELREAEEEYANKREDTTQTNLQKEAAHKLKVEQIKEKHARGEAQRQEDFKRKVADVHSEYEKAISGIERPGGGAESSAATAAETRRSALGGVKERGGPVYQRLKGMVDRVATEDVPKLEKTVRQAYNARWGAWREAMGDAEGNFSPVQQAVVDAESDILKGSPENIAIFRNILKEGEDPLLSQASVFRKKPGVDVKSVLGGEHMTARGQERLLASLREAGIEDIDEGFPTVGPGENVTLPIDQIRGYGTELQSKMFRGGFSGDVYRALKHVQEAANREVERVAQSKGQLATYRQLKSDWSQFLGDFLDSDGSLNKLKNAANADSRLNLISGSEGENIISALGRYSKFLPKDASGQTPIDIAGRTRSLVHQLSALPSGSKPPMRGELPARPEARPEPALPAPPVPKEMPEFKPPQMKDVPVDDIVPFDLPKFVEERVNKRAEQIGMAGHTLLAYWVIRDIFHGQVPSPQMLAVPLVQAQIRRYLTSPRFIQKITSMAAQ